MHFPFFWESRWNPRAAFRSRTQSRNDGDRTHDPQNVEVTLWRLEQRSSMNPKPFEILRSNTRGSIRIKKSKIYIVLVFYCVIQKLCCFPTLRLCPLRTQPYIYLKRPTPPPKTVRGSKVFWWGAEGAEGGAESLTRKRPENVRPLSFSSKKIRPLHCRVQFITPYKWK